MLDFDYIDWDDEDDMNGNVQHIAAADLTVEEVEDVLYDPDSDVDVSRSTGRTAAFGTTSTNKYIVVICDVDTQAGITVARPVTAYEVEPPD